MEHKNFKVLLLFFASFIFTSGICFSQNGGVNLMLGFPQGEFKRNVDRLGYGLSAHYMFWDVSLSTPFSLGLNLGYLNYGSETRSEPFSLTIPDVTVNVQRTNNLVNFHLLLQIMPPLGTLRPYMEGLFGGSYIFTSTDINSQDGLNKDVAASTNFSDWAWSYGGGGGLMFKVFENNKTDIENSKVATVWVDLKARYLLGTQAEYLKEGSVIINNSKVTYDISKSKTDLITAQLGVVIFLQ
jgi:hypothetical protein